jgi:hypothetical protein
MKQKLIINHMKRLKFTPSPFTLLFLLLSCSSLIKAQTVNQKLYVSITDVTPSVKTFFNDNDIKSVYTFNIVGGSYDAVDQQKLIADIQKRYPGVSDSGIAALDWEGTMIGTLVNGRPESSDFNDALNSYIKLLKMAKALRPNVKWGYYAVPFSRFYNRNKLGSDLRKIEPLLRVCDVFFPSFYENYRDGSIEKDDNERFAYENLNAILPVAQRMDKPVLPFVWYRYHVSNKNIGLQLIPNDEFEKYLNAILSVNYNGKKVSGVVCWSVDSYYFKKKSVPLLNEMSESGSQDFDSYHDALVKKYTGRMLNLMKKKNQ